MEKRKETVLSRYINRKTDVESIVFSDFVNPHSFYKLLSADDDVFIQWLQTRNLKLTTMECSEHRTLQYVIIYIGKPKSQSHPVVIITSFPQYYASRQLGAKYGRIYININYFGE